MVTTFAVRHVEQLLDVDAQRVQLFFNVSMSAELSVKVSPSDLVGNWMNSVGQLVICSKTSCTFQGTSSTPHSLRPATVSIKGAKSLEAVALGSTGWAAVRSSPSGIAWLKETPGTVWWDKLPESPAEVARSMVGTRWHNDAGQTIRVLSSPEGSKVCFGFSVAKAACYFLKRNAEYGYLGFNNWVLIDYFRNTRDNMEAHWRLKEGSDHGTKLRDVVWYTDALKPELQTLIGTWMNTHGQVVTCSSEQCAFEDGGDVYALSNDRAGVALGSTGWIAVDFDQAGITWEKLGAEQTTWWNKLPADPAAVWQKLQEVRTWTNTVGQRIVVRDNEVVFDERTSDPIRIVGPKLMMKDWVVVDLFENHNGAMEVFWRELSNRKKSAVREQTVRWVQEFFGN